MLENGQSYQSVAKAIRTRFNEYSNKVPSGKHIRNRAELVSITESANAYQQSNVAMIRSATDTGLTFQKKWVTVGDNRVSAGCESNSSEGFIALDDTFSSGHDVPPRFPGCRCSAVYQRS